MSAYDGMQISRNIYVHHGSGNSNYMLMSDAMYWDPYDKLHMAFSRTSNADGLPTLDNQLYAAKLRIGKLDVSTTGSE